MSAQQNRSIAITLLLLSSLLMSGNSYAAGDIEQGEKQAKLCEVCHATTSDSSVPTLAGQHQRYLTQQIEAYKYGRRDDPIMKVIALRLSNQDEINNITAYYASLPREPRLTTVAKDTELGEKVYQEQYQCAACHGAQGEGNPTASPAIPKLAGQNKDYIVKRLMDFQKQHEMGQQDNPMVDAASQLNIVDIFSVAEYLNDL